MKRVYGLASTFLAAAVPAWAQCSMCRTALNANGLNAGDTFNRAILILLVPAVAMFGTIFLAFVRYAGSGGEDKPEE